MAATERRPILLDFEKPLVELESRIVQIRELAEENDVDVSDQIRQFSSVKKFLVTFRQLSACRWRGIPAVPAR
jgi:acetyl-CoA carboxylase alpha subunit